MWPFKNLQLSRIKKQIESALIRIRVRLYCNAKRTELLMDRVSAIEKTLKKYEQKGARKNARKTKI